MHGEARRRFVKYLVRLVCRVGHRGSQEVLVVCVDHAAGTGGYPIDALVTINLVMFQGMRMPIQIQIDLPFKKQPCEVFNVNLVGLVMPDCNDPIVLVDCIQGALEPSVLRLTVLGDDVLVEMARLIRCVLALAVGAGARIPTLGVGATISCDTGIGIDEDKGCIVGAT